MQRRSAARSRMHDSVVKIKLPIPFPLRSVNCYFIQGPVPTLIDAGINTPQARRALHAALTRLGSGLDKIRRIIVTHGHLDHAGMAGWISARSNVDILVTAVDYPKINIPHEEGAKDMQQRYADFLKMAGVTEDIITRIIRRLMARRRTFVFPMPEALFINDQDELDCNGITLKVVTTPGHTPGAICLYNSADGALFSGDTLLESITPNPVIELDNPLFNGVYPSLRNYTKSLAILKGLPVKRVWPGHGNLFQDHVQRITQIEDHIHKRKQQVLKIVKKLQGKNGALLVEIAGRLFPMLRRNQIFLGLSESVAHLECLKEEGQLAQDKFQGRIYYHSIDD